MARRNGPRTRPASAGRRTPPPAPPRRDWLVAGLAAAGLAIAGYLAATKLAGGAAAFCAAGGGCDLVQSSRYATFLGLPTALWGAALYAAVGGLALLGLDERRWSAAMLLAAAGAGFSLYLTYLELFVIEAVCGYCVASALIALALFALLAVRRPAPSGRRSLARPRRLAASAALSAVAAVVVAAGIYAAGAETTSAGYQQALARHLEAAGAVMYGAFW